ncbi:MAG: glycoside hydrolase family 3 C-terminal domain-containing protein [Treponema sp.]|jgi:beta-glucosidase|nr:glycoside hydrolase family 3 C-terminal domain-containing protein [Treponema sp.]
MKNCSRILASAAALSLVFSGCASSKVKELTKYAVKEVKTGNTTHIVVTNPKNGPVLGYAKNSGLKLLEVETNGITYAFKDMNGNGTLDVWEDWRESIDARAKALSQELTKDEIAGLMLFSSHERAPEEGLTEAQKNYLKNDNLRNVLNAGANNVEALVSWNNAMQAYVEGLIAEGRRVIPVNFSSDPRSTAGSDAQYNAGGEDISRWPSNLGIAATFEPKTMLLFARSAAEEYRAMGIATALGPQIELATDPRWLRFDGTFGENTQLAVDMTKAYVDGSQSTYGNNEDIGWSVRSINTMIKHFPGDGMGEGGRESHMESGKYAVYPGNNFEEHLKPFIRGGLTLNGKTKKAASMMLSYSAAVGPEGNPLFGAAKGSAYDQAKIDILRKTNNYEGVLCTDWGVTSTIGDPGNTLGLGMAWGMEDASIAQRHYEILLTGMDMFGGNNDKQPVLEAYDMWEQRYQEGLLPVSGAERFRQSGERLVTLILNTGLFENPYLSLSESKAVVGSQDKRDAGYQAQLDSIVMLKNKNQVIKKADVQQDYKNKTVYIPSSIRRGFKTVFAPAMDTKDPTMDIGAAEQYFKEVLTDTPITNPSGTVTGFQPPDLSNVDLVIIGMMSPDNGNNFSSAGLKDGAFYPLSLQYRPYTANGDKVRKTSISGDMLANGGKQNRGYFGAVSLIANEYDLDALLNARNAVAGVEAKTGRKIPLLVALKAKNPTIVQEFEPYADGIVTGFSVSDQAYFDILLGKQEPRGLLPMQFPKDMAAVEAQLEDVGQDLVPYTDEMGNVYDFGYGLGYAGVISDERTARYAGR